MTGSVDMRLGQGGSQDKERMRRMISIEDMRFSKWVTVSDKERMRNRMTGIVDMKKAEKRED